MVSYIVFRSLLWLVCAKIVFAAGLELWRVAPFDLKLLAAVTPVGFLLLSIYDLACGRRQLHAPANSDQP